MIEILLRYLAGRFLRSRAVCKSELYKGWLYGRAWRRLHEEPRVESVSLETVHACNLACRFCSHPAMTRARGVMSDAVFVACMERIRDEGVKKLCLQGFGEPLLDPQIFDRAKLAKEQYGVEHIFLSTNATLLSAAACEALVDSGIDEIGVSIDAGDRQQYMAVHQHDCFDTVYDNLQRLKAVIRSRGFGPVVGLKYKLPLGLRGAFKFRKKFAPVADTLHYYTTIMPFPGAVEYEKHLFPNAIQMPCTWLWHTLCINWTGSAYMCCLDMDCKTDYGSLLDHTIGEVFNGEGMSELRKKHLQNEFAGQCRTCVMNSHLVLPTA